MRILVIRLSAMGDVALTLPVLKAFVSQYPGHEVVLLTRKAYGPLFRHIPALTVFSPDLDERHRGFAGIFRLFKDIGSNGQFDCVIDLHDVLRSKILCFLFRMSGTRVVRIDKGRKEKNNLIRGRRKVQLKHTVERYTDVFREAGFEIVPCKGKSIFPGIDAREQAASLLTGTTGILNIGVAPFARHALKQWPVEKMVRLIEMISAASPSRFWLFGGKDECLRIAQIEKSIPAAVSLCGKLTLDEELAVMERLDLMITMDSSNMHMAALSGIKVFSVWGATDPMAGFGAWDQPKEYSLGISHNLLSCRPCTVFGKGTCRRGDFACMMWLTPETVFKELEKLGMLHKRI